MTSPTPEEIEDRLTEFVGDCMLLCERLAAFYRESGHSSLVPASAMVAQAAGVLNSRLEDDRLDRLEAACSITDEDLRALVDKGLMREVLG